MFGLERESTSHVLMFCLECELTSHVFRFGLERELTSHVFRFGLEHELTSHVFRFGLEHDGQLVEMRGSETAHSAQSSDSGVPMVGRKIQLVFFGNKNIRHKFLKNKNPSEFF